MVRRPFHLTDLTLVVGYAALGLATFRDPTGYQRQDPSFLVCPLIVSLTLVVMLSATLAARFCDDSRRPFWWGFALFGWASLAISFGIGVDWRFGSSYLPSLLFVDGAKAIASQTRGAWHTSIVSVTDYAGITLQANVLG